MLDALGRFQGVRTAGVERYLSTITESGRLVNMGRAQAEQDDEHKQILVYVLVRRQDRLLAYRRGVYNYTDATLRGSDCVGFGGHVSADDQTLMSADGAGLFEAASRELMEELSLPQEDVARLIRGEGLSIIGLLNDDSSIVGQRHFAVVMDYAVSSSAMWDRPARGEKSITQLRWIGRGVPQIQLETFEYWSQLALRSFARDLFVAVPNYRVVRRAGLRQPHLLVVAGQIGSGKTEAAKALVDEWGYYSINSGQVLAELMNIPPVPSTPRSDFQQLADEFIRSSSGSRRLAKRLVSEARNAESGRVLVDGVRQVETYRAIQALFRPSTVGLIYVYAPPDVAFSLYRRRENRRASIGDFLKLRAAPAEAEVAELFGLADGVLYNWFGRQKYRSIVRRLIRETNE